MVLTPPGIINTGRKGSSNCDIVSYRIVSYRGCRMVVVDGEEKASLYNPSLTITTAKCCTTKIYASNRYRIMAVKGND